MSLALIEESAKEVRRLAIAGSPLAVGDFRLKKLIPPLEQAGAKAPVFTQVAQALTALVNGSEAESAARLLSVSTLLNAILYTQGQSSSAGDFRELEAFPTNCCTTRTTARLLKPLTQALTTAGAGRFEQVKSAYESGTFSDLRLVEPAIRALDDSFPELAELVAEKILPAYGPGIVPLLKSNFELKGKKSDARRLKIMHRLDSAGTLDLCKTALDEGSAEVKVAAVGCLGKHEECLPLVLEQSNSKNKAVRAAALEALAEHDRPEITKLFGDLIKGKALDILARPLRAMRNRQVLKSLLDEGKRILDLLLKGDVELIPRFSEILDCLPQGKEAEAEEFLLGCFAQREKLLKLKPAKISPVAGSNLTTRLAELLYLVGSAKALQAVLDGRDVLPLEAFTHVLHSALRTWPAPKAFDEFSPLLAHKKGAGKEKTRVIERTIWAACYGELQKFYLWNMDLENPEIQMLKSVAWDPRWLDAAVETDQPRIVCCLARAGHKSAVNYLLKLLQGKTEVQASLVLEALARCQYPKLTDVFLELVGRKTKNSRYFDFEWHSLFESVRCLPPSDLPRLDAFAAKLDEKYVDKYLEALAPLRAQKIEKS